MERKRVRHPRLVAILDTVSIISAVGTGIFGFGYGLRLPTIACMLLTFCLVCYVGFFEKVWE